MRGVAKSKVSSLIPEASFLRKVGEEGRRRLVVSLSPRLYLWTVPGQKVLEQGLLSVALGEVLLLSQPISL